MELKQSARDYRENWLDACRLLDEREAEIDLLRKLLQQVLEAAQSDDVLLGWWHALECATVPNAKVQAEARQGRSPGTTGSAAG